MARKLYEIRVEESSGYPKLRVPALALACLKIIDSTRFVGIQTTATYSSTSSYVIRGRAFIGLLL